MKKLITLVLILFQIFSLFALAQEGCLFVGAKLGVTANNIIAGTEYRDYKYTNELGIKLTVPVVYEATKHWGLESGISLTTKNYYLERDFRIKMIDLKVENAFLSVPLSLNFSIPCDQNCSFLLRAGGYLGWWCWGKSKGNIADLNRNIQSVNETADLSLKNQFEYGLLAALGFSFSDENFRFIISAEFETDLSGLNKEQEVGAYQIYNSTMLLNYSLLWRVK